VRLGERLVTFPTHKTLALLIYLAIEPGLHPREYLATLLWPEANSERSYASLRNTLSHLHATLRQPGSEATTSFISVTHNALGLNPDADIYFDLQTVARSDCSRQTITGGLSSRKRLRK
jgi:DNA-binding SARP family transcriptional activator